MNTTLPSYPSFGSADFESSIESPQRFKAIGIFPSGTAVIPFSTVTLTGFAESVNQVVAKKAADLSPSLRQQVTVLSRLDEKWDGERAKAVKLYVLADVVEALNRFTQQTKNFQEPFLAPTFDGFVQMEWHSNKRSLEIEAVDRGWYSTGTMTGTDGNRHYFTAECERSDFGTLEKFYEWYIGVELLWPSM